MRWTTLRKSKREPAAAASNENRGAKNLPVPKPETPHIEAKAEPKVEQKSEPKVEDNPRATGQTVARSAAASRSRAAGSAVAAAGSARQSQPIAAQPLRPLTTPQEDESFLLQTRVGPAVPPVLPPAKVEAAA